MFWVRVRSSIILMAIAIATIVLGGNVMFGVVVAISLIGLMELYRVMGMHKSVLGAFGYLAALAYDALIYLDLEAFRFEWIVITLMFMLGIYVVSYPKYKAEQVSMALFGLLYVVVMLSYLYRIRMLTDGFLLVWLVFIGSWGSDTCAYLVGMAIGKHKAFPRLSPKKSVEGCIGGIVGAGLLGLLYGFIFRGQMTQMSNPPFACLCICAAASVLSQIGDLAASAIKRNHDIKDYGTLIPGHGGILDRFDSVIVTAPVVYLLAILLQM